MSEIAKNLQLIQSRIEELCLQCGREKDAVTLIAVTKTRKPEEIQQAIDWGVTKIGENKVQEIMDKYDAVGKVSWHMIGHLQTNKVKYIIDKVDLIHSVDSYHLAQEIDRRAREKNLTMDILIQINAAHEESKFGVDADGFDGLIHDVAVKCPNLCIKGLMTIAPYAPDPEDVRIYFRQVKEVFDKYQGKTYECEDGSRKTLTMEHLSMGMSGDYAVAIEEGATMVRIGSAIFGERDYSKV